MTNPSEDTGKHPTCRLCDDGTYAVVTHQDHVAEDRWIPYCQRCSEVYLSIYRDARKPLPEVRQLPPPPGGKAPPPKVRVKIKAEAPPPKVKGKKGAAKAIQVVAPPPSVPVPAPVPVAPVRTMTLAEAMRPTAPKLPPPPPVKPSSAVAARNALREAARGVEGYDLLSMLGMKR